MKTVHVVSAITPPLLMCIYIVCVMNEGMENSDVCIHRWYIHVGCLGSDVCRWYIHVGCLGSDVCR